MKIIVSATAADVNAPADSRFGRAPFFALYDSEAKSLSFHPNLGIQSAHGAGVQASQMVIDLGAEVVITGQLGPNSWDILHRAGVKCMQGQGISVQDWLDAYNNGSLGEIPQAGGAHGGQRLRRGN
jgi:predicted Fe-Mo cluster-binding NifX family protein